VQVGARSSRQLFSTPPSGPITAATARLLWVALPRAFLLGRPQEWGQIHIPHHAPLNEHSFPVMRMDDKANSVLTKALVTQNRRNRETENPSKSKSKL